MMTARARASLSPAPPRAALLAKSVYMLPRHPGNEKKNSSRAKRPASAREQIENSFHTYAAP